MFFLCTPLATRHVIACRAPLLQIGKVDSQFASGLSCENTHMGPMISLWSLEDSFLWSNNTPTDSGLVGRNTLPWLCHATPTNRTFALQPFSAQRLLRPACLFSLPGGSLNDWSQQKEGRSLVGYLSDST